MNTNLLAIVKQITAEYGEDVLGDANRLKAFFGDLAKDESKPLRLAFGRAIEEDAYNALKTSKDAAERAERKAAIAQKLLDEHGLDVALSGEALDILEAAMFGERNAAQITTAPPSEQQTTSASIMPAQENESAAVTLSEPVTAAPIQPDAPEQPTPESQKQKLRNVLIAAGVVIAVVAVVIGKNYSSTTAQSVQPESSGTASDAELRGMAAEIAEIAEANVFEGFDPTEVIKHYYFIPISVDEFQYLSTNDEFDFSKVTAYATDDGVIKARRAGYQANYGVIVYSENGETVMGLADVTSKEEDIYVGYDFGTLKYSLSNRLGDIEQAIYARTGKTISLSNVQWTLNTGLSENVKASMNEHNVNYSMTVSSDYTGRYFIVNKRESSRWYYFGLNF
jgi:hypothetical protein